MVDDVPLSILEKGQWIVNNQWVVDEKIASGGFGSVYKGHDNKTGEIVAVKTEKKKNKQNYVDKEIQIYSAIGDTKGFPRLRWTGKTFYPLSENEEEVEACTAMVIDFLGPSLSDLFYKHNKMFSLKTVLIIADQMIERLEALHDKGVVHRDIKPGNFVMGVGENAHCVYLIDFGLAHIWRDASGSHIPFETNVPFRGTHRYASINAHFKIEQTRRDDLESLAYVLIYFLKGGLPWQNLNVERNKRRAVIGEMKRAQNVGDVTAGLPIEFKTYLEVVRSLKFEEKPNYKYLRDLFKSCLEKHKEVNDYVYEWTKVEKSTAQNSSKKIKKISKEDANNNNNNNNNNNCNNNNILYQKQPSEESTDNKKKSKKRKKSAAAAATAAGGGVCRGGGGGGAAAEGEVSFDEIESTNKKKQKATPSRNTARYKEGLRSRKSSGFTTNTTGDIIEISDDS